MRFGGLVIVPSYDPPQLRIIIVLIGQFVKAITGGPNVADII